MKILFLTRLYEPHIGGVEKHVKRLTQELEKEGHTVTIVTEQFDPALPVHQVGIHDIYRIPVSTTGHEKKRVFWRWFWDHRKLLRDADMIHCHDVFFWVLPFRFLYPFKKIYTTFHGYESYPVSWKAVIVRKLSEILSNRSICVGDFMKKWYFAKPDIITYGAVDIPKSFDAKPRKISALFFGRLDSQTGIDLYVDVYRIIKEKHPHFELTVIGDGDYQDRLPKDITHKHFQTDVSRDIQKHRFIFVSRYLSILEALVSKRLVFAIPTSPIHHDYLEMSPFRDFIVLVTTPQQLASKINYFLKNSDEEKKLVNEGYKWVQKQTWDHLVLQYYTLWGK